MKNTFAFRLMFIEHDFCTTMYATKEWPLYANITKCQFYYKTLSWGYQKGLNDGEYMCGKGKPPLSPSY